MHAMWYLDAIQVPAVWAMGYSGKGIMLRINDDGLDYTNPDLTVPRFSLAHSHGDPMPQNGQEDTHGTVCAALAAAG